MFFKFSADILDDDIYGTKVLLSQILLAVEAQFRQIKNVVLDNQLIKQIPNAETNLMFFYGKTITQGEKMHQL